MQSACAVSQHITICGPSGSTIFFPHYLKNGTIFGKKLLNTESVFLFSLQLLSDTFLIMKRNQRGIVINVKKKYPLLLIKLESSRQIFENTSNIKFHENPSSESRVPCGRMDGRTDATKLIVAFHNFSNVLKNDRNVLRGQNVEFRNRTGAT